MTSSRARCNRRPGERRSSFRQLPSVAANLWALAATSVLDKGIQSAFINRKSGSFQKRLQRMRRKRDFINFWQ